MIVCSNCNHTNISGAMFCSECGAQLPSADSLTTQNIATGKVQPAVKEPSVSVSAPRPVGGFSNWVTLHLMDTGQVLPLNERNEFTLGRVSEGQPIMPDIDLSPY